MNILTIQDKHVYAKSDGSTVDLGEQRVVLAYEAEELEKRCTELENALREIADYDYQCQCVDGIEDGEDHFGCPSCWARKALGGGE